MNRQIARLGTLVAILPAMMLLTPIAGAQEIAQMKPIREAFPMKRQGCFARAYDARHLAANPNQSVTRIRLARLSPELKREAIDGPEGPTVGLRLLLKIKAGAGGTEALDCVARYEGAAAAAQPYLTCRSTCHRGSIDVTPLGPDSLKLTIGGMASGRFVPDAIGVGASCTSDTGVTWLGDREGDRTFLLSRSALEACR